MEDRSGSSEFQMKSTLECLSDYQASIGMAKPVERNGLIKAQKMGMSRRAKTGYNSAS